MWLDDDILVPNGISTTDQCDCSTKTYHSSDFQRRTNLYRRIKYPLCPFDSVPPTPPTELRTVPFVWERINSTPLIISQTSHSHVLKTNGFELPIHNMPNMLVRYLLHSLFTQPACCFWPLFHSTHFFASPFFVVLPLHRFQPQPPNSSPTFDMWLWLFPHVRRFWENVWQFIPRLRFFLSFFF